MADMQPGWAVLDMVALALLRVRPRVQLYALLRGEAVPTDTDGNAAPDYPPGPEGRLERLLLRLGCDPVDAAHLAADGRDAAGRLLRRAREGGIDVVPWSDPRYPAALQPIPDPPLVLWGRGDLTALSAPAVAIVGSRGASPYGEEAAERLAYGLAGHGLVIVSGLARGIDAAAHRGALAATARTIAVLGCGVDVVYPPEHVELMSEIVRHGAVVSEYPPGTPPDKAHFPERNRIISGLSRGVVVVEARQRSGALITADCALEQGREVMAVPGNVLSDRHRGSHALLKAGAAFVETAQDVLDVLHIAGCGPASPSSGAVDPLVATMDTGETYALDSLAALSRQDASTLLPRLLELELRGLIRRLPGGRFTRASGERANVGSTLPTAERHS